MNPGLQAQNVGYRGKGENNGSNLTWIRKERRQAMTTALSIFNIL